LNLNDDQFNQLNRSYGEYWNRYNQGMSQMGRDINEQQRMQRLRELEGNFQRDFSTSTNRVFTDPQQRERFNQLQLQYQGFGAFNDPRIQQQLNLTPQQRQRLNELNTEWNTQMGRLGTEFQTGDQGISNRLRNMRQQFNQRFDAILNDEQRQLWQGMVGEPFDFPPEVFFQTNTDVGGTQTNNPRATNNGRATTNRTNRGATNNGANGANNNGATNKGAANPPNINNGAINPGAVPGATNPAAPNPGTSNSGAINNGTTNSGTTNNGATNPVTNGNSGVRAGQNNPSNPQLPR
jgi:hypothetical protein